MQQQQQVAPAGLMEQFASYLARDYLQRRRINQWHHEAHDRVALPLTEQGRNPALREIWRALGLGSALPDEVELEARIRVERAGKEWSVELHILTHTPLDGVEGEDIDLRGILLDDEDGEDADDAATATQPGREWYDQLVGWVLSSDGRIYVDALADTMSALTPIMGWFYQRVREAL